jgi:hypothetical protein
MSPEFENVFGFVFEETYRMWRSDLEKIFRIGTRGKNGGCNLSSCILVLIGIESFAHCFSDKKSDAEAVDEFVNKYYPNFYHGKMKSIHELFRHGLAHNYYPKSEFNLVNTSLVAFGVDEKGRVVSLSRLRKNIENCRNKVLKLDPKPGKPYVVVPQVLFIDTVNVMESLKRRVSTDTALQGNLVKNCKRVKRNLRHIT